MSDKSYIVTTEKNPNPNFIPPPNPIIGTKCPYRIFYHFKGGLDQRYDTSLNNAVRIESEFQDCIGKDCACWTPIGCKK